MTIDFMVKIILFDCYLTKLGLLYVLKTRAVAAGVVSLTKHKVRSCQTAPPPQGCHRALWSPSVGCPTLQRASRSTQSCSGPPSVTHAWWQSMGHTSSVFLPSRCPQHWHRFSYLGNASTCLQHSLWAVGVFCDEDSLRAERPEFHYNSW